MQRAGIRVEHEDIADTTAHDDFTATHTMEASVFPSAPSVPVWQPVLPTDRSRRPADRQPLPQTTEDRGLVAVGIGAVGALIGVFVMLLGGYGSV